MKICEIEGCGKPARTPVAKVCKMHYHRMYRTGSYELTPKITKKTIYHSAGYIVKYAPDHPLCKNLVKDYEYEHRIVFYDTHGEGPFNCHWCGVQVCFNNMHVDHLDNNKKNNSPDNLVASCPYCNIHRSKESRNKKIRESVGVFIEHEGERMCKSEWAERLGVSKAAFDFRISNWGLPDAITKKVRNNKNRK